MARLLLYTDDKITSEIPLGQGTVTIGREKDNDIQLKDRSVSQHHAKIVTFFKPTYIQDLRSTNGTYVNGKRVMERTLKQGDEIMIGKQRMVFDMETAEIRSSEPQSTMELSADELNQMIHKEQQEKS